VIVAEHIGGIIVRSLLIAFGTSGVVIGATQIARTLRLGALTTNADDVIRRGGITIGVGAALLYAAFART
jgi:hypothetical protein